jgi:hypothetical protein
MELETIFDEQIEINKKYVLPISKLVYDKPYNFLFINTDLQTLSRTGIKLFWMNPLLKTGENTYRSIFSFAILLSKSIYI